MVNIRTTDGKLFALRDNARFVEICDKSGAVAAIVYITDYGAVRVITPGDAEFSRYIKTYSPKVSRVIKLP